MAIDSAEKRRAAAGAPFLPFGPGVTPNASPDVEWRYQAGWSYSGVIDLTPLTPSDTPRRMPITMISGWL